MSGRRWALPAVFAGGMVFGAGLALSRMTQPEVVLDFLQLQDLGLLWVMGAAAALAGVVFHWGARSGRSAPLTGTRYGLRRPTFDRNVLVGGAIFGVGWGISGICPGAAYASLGIGNAPIALGLAGMLAGAYGLRWWQARTPSGSPKNAQRV